MAVSSVAAQASNCQPGLSFHQLRLRLAVNGQAANMLKQQLLSSKGIRPVRR